VSLPSNHEVRLERNAWIILAALAVFSVSVYVAVSCLTFRVGFPLDDAWIHQTYARNLALQGEWAFIPGDPSAGSTAPLWSVLLAIGYWIGLAPYVWTFIAGAAILWVLSAFVEIAARKFAPTYRPRFPWMGALMAMEWHLVWAAGSGMETLLFAFLVSVILLKLVDSQRYAMIGLLIGLSVWIRPDGITLLGPAMFTILLKEPGWRERMKAVQKLLLGFSSLFALYLLFNFLLEGSLLPNTFYAKQAEYAILREAPFWKRYSQMLLQPILGVGLVLTLGVLLTIIKAVQTRNLGMLAGMIWFLGFLGLYAWSLPETYQQGRYLIPAMPVFFFWGTLGLLTFPRRPAPQWQWMLDTAWRALTVVILVLYWMMGAAAYGQDVAVIESEMVTAARWVSENIPPEASVAAHDIGALGYFGGHELVDLAGLVSPEVIPFIRDEARLETYLIGRGVEYLVTFPGWYPSITEDLEEIFITNGRFAPAMGEENMIVFILPDR